jgi:hypothetical protein
MNFDVSKFYLHNAIDSCAIWHLISSKLFYSLVDNAKVTLCCTDYVQYECLFKIRKDPQKSDIELQKYLESLIEADKIKCVSLTLAELQDMEVLSKRKNLGKGELSLLAYIKNKPLAFLSDDDNACKFARQEAKLNFIQTIPHLLGWLTYNEKISESDKDTIISQHTSYGGTFVKRFQKAYDEGCRCRQMSKSL